MGAMNILICTKVFHNISKLVGKTCKGSSETPLHFILRYKGDSVGRYRRYGCIRLYEKIPLGSYTIGTK